jgi:hypothetical protein
LENRTAGSLKKLAFGLSFLHSGKIVEPKARQNVNYFLAAFFFAAAGRAGLLLPYEPAKVLPFLVFLSPLPIIDIFSVKENFKQK